MHFSPSKKNGFTHLNFPKTKSFSGFTVIELLVVLAIIAIIAALSFAWFPPLILKEKINKEVRLVTSFLDEARSRTLSGVDASEYGVHLLANQVTLFKGDEYDPSGLENKVHDLGSSVYVSAGSNASVVFEKLSGAVSGATEPRYITLSAVDNSVEVTIVVYPSGLIEKN